MLHKKVSDFSVSQVRTHFAVDSFIFQCGYHISLSFHYKASVFFHLYSNKHTPCFTHCHESASTVKISTSLINKYESTCTNIWHSVLATHPHTHPWWEVKACEQSGETVISAHSLQLNRFQFSFSLAWKIKPQRKDKKTLPCPFWTTHKMAEWVCFSDEKLKPTDDEVMTYNSIQHKRRFQVQVRVHPLSLSKGWKIQTPATISRKP